MLHMPQTWAFATGKSSQGNRAGVSSGRAGQAALRITRTADHAIKVSPTRNSPKRAAWASRDNLISQASADWGATHSLPVARALLALDPQVSTVGSDRLARRSGAAVIVLDRSFHGALSAFGEKTAKAIRKAAADCGVQTSDPLAEITYRDRFARSPIVLRMLIDSIAALAKGNNAPLSVDTAPDKRSDFSRLQVSSDIESDNALKALAAALGARRSISGRLAFGQPPHKRSLSFTHASGQKLIVDLDQAFGWLVYDGSDRSFDPGSSSSAMTARIANLAGNVCRRHSHDSQMVVWRP